MQPDAYATPASSRRTALYRLYGLLIPDRYAAYSVEALGAFLEPINRRSLLRIVAGQPGQFVLYGPVGTGKTSIASVVAREWALVTGKVVAFVAFGAFCSQLSSLDYGVAETVVTQIETAPILILDDLGDADKTWNGQLAAETPKRVGLAGDIVAMRHAKQLPTIVTSNLDNRGFEVQFGARLASRLAEFQNVFVGGRDLRQKGAA